MSKAEKPNSRGTLDAQASAVGPAEPASVVARALVLSYGVLVYVGFLAIFLYIVGFLMRFGVPRTIDDGVMGSGAAGVALNVLLMNLILTWLVVAWRPFPTVIWQLEGMPAVIVTGIALLGWAIVLLSTFLTDHWELFGVKQALAYGLGRTLQPAQFRERSFYSHVRHPMMLGFIIAFWAAPTLTLGYLLFAGVSTAYILVALFIEERTLVELHGAAYQDYQRRVPKLFPRLFGVRAN